MDIESYYPSISATLMDEALDWAQGHTEISELETKIIRHARETYLWYKNEVWIKKNTDDNVFDIPMGSLDGSECSDLIGFLY